MATTFVGWRPSPLRAAHPSVVPALEGRLVADVVAAPALLPGRAATTAVPTVPTYAGPVTAIDNSTSAPATWPTGVNGLGNQRSTSIPAQASDAMQGNDFGKHKGEDARGNPPRGRRRV